MLAQAAPALQQEVPLRRDTAGCVVLHQLSFAMPGLGSGAGRLRMVFRHLAADLVPTLQPETRSQAFDT